MTPSPKRARPHGGQAKVLTAPQIKAIVAYLRDHHRHAQRDLVMFLLSVRAGLRVVEIRRLRWGMVTGSDGRVGDELALRGAAT